MKKKSAFTLIEVLIMIAVFAIGILAVLRLVTQNLVMLDSTKSRTIATFLAKEGIELVYNMRDSNIAKGLPWDCVLKSGILTNEDVCAWNFSYGIQDNTILQVSFDPQGYVYTNPVSLASSFSDLRNQNRLYYVMGDVGGYQTFRYAHHVSSGSNQTMFARYIRFVNVREGTQILPVDSIMKIESHVLYMKGSRTGEVILESFIGNH